MGNNIVEVPLLSASCGSCTRSLFIHSPKMWFCCYNYVRPLCSYLLPLSNTFSLWPVLNVACFCRVHGRPPLDVSIDDIEYLRGLRFTWTKIAEVLRISRSTLYRWLDQEGIDRDLHYTDISDYDLHRVVESIKQSHPNGHTSPSPNTRFSSAAS